MAVSKVKQDVTDEDVFDPDEDLPTRPKIQTLTKPENLIKIPDPKYDTNVDFPTIAKEIPDDEVEADWQRILDQISYDKERWIIAKVRIDTVEARTLKDKRMEILEGVSDYDFNVSAKLPRDLLENKFKKELLSVCAGLLQESGFGSMLRGRLYSVMIAHVKRRIFSGKSLSETDDDAIEFALNIMPEIQKNFTKPIVTGIVGNG